MRFLPLLLAVFSSFSSCHYFSEDVLDDYFFEGVTDEFVDWYANFTYPDEPFDTILNNSKYYSYYIAGPSIFVILLHLFVFTRKSMMTSSTNILLIAIAIGDLGFLVTEIVRYMNTKYQESILLDNMYAPRLCIPPLSYTLVVCKWLSEVIRDYLNRASAWSAVLLTALRSMVVRSNTMSSATLTTTRFGWRMTLLIFTLSLFIPIVEVLSHNVNIFNTWKSGPSCAKQETAHSYSIDFDNEFPMSQSTIALLDSCLFQFIPSITVVFYTILLLVELRRARRRSVKLGGEGMQSSKISLLVFLIALSFVFVRILQAVVTILNAWSVNRYGFLDVISRLSNFVNLSFTVNALVHFLICVSLSSQYRDTAKRMIGIGRKKSDGIEMESSSEE